MPVTSTSGGRSDVMPIIRCEKDGRDTQEYSGIPGIIAGYERSDTDLQAAGEKTVILNYA